MAQTFKLQLTEDELQFLQSGVQAAINFNKTVVNWSNKDHVKTSAANLKTLSSLEVKINKIKNVINYDAN